MNLRKLFRRSGSRPAASASTYYRLPFSGLTGRILVLNVIGLAVLVGGILYVNQYRTGLIETRLTALRSQAEMLAGALAETVDSETETGALEKERAASLLRRLSADRADRVRLFETDGTLALDTRKLNPSTQVVTIPLPPPGQREQVSMLQALWEKFRAFSIRAMSSDPNYPLYEERYDQTAADYPEVLKALTGEPDQMVRVRPDRSLVLTVAVPVEHFRHVLGALLVSVETTEIEEVVRQERLAILEIFLVALSVTMLLSFLLAGTIARPVQRLAAFAHTVRQGRGRQAIVPDFSRRRDEVGDLSRALRDMTQALYRRIDTIEGFAADVAHEVKNPLTSLRSAVETMERTQNPDHKTKLMHIIKHDIDRLTRLISDISNASRLDAEMLREDMQEIDVPSMMREIIGIYATHDDKVLSGKSSRRPRIVLDVEGYNLVVYGIESHLGQVMRNLIDNAISFSPTGGVIAINVRRNRDTLFITVDDEGPGIPDERLDEIFERFYSERPEEEGFGSHSGLGLNISRQIIAVHDGSLRAENRYSPEGPVGPPMGARFTITLPAVGMQQKTPQAVRPDFDRNRMTTIHATCVDIDGLGVLLRGPSGSGKSDLALRLIDAGAQLVSDDYTVLEVRGDRLIGTAPQSIKGMLEVRGVGILPMPVKARSVIAMVADLVTDGEIERLPDPDAAVIDGIVVPRIQVAPFEVSAAAKVRLAAKKHGPQDSTA